MSSGYIPLTTNAQGQAAPSGYHYMPDGKLMRNADMQIKNISEFVLDTSDIEEAGEVRSLVIEGDDGAEFILEIKNGDNYYYNFVTNTFQAAQAKLDKTMTGSNYTAQVNFPPVEDEDQYDVFLYAKPGTKHALYNEVRFADGSLDINSSSGSNSLMLQKVIYQYLNIILTISTAAPTLTFTPSASTDNEITISSGKSKGKIPFTVTSTSATDESFVISAQPSSNNVYSAFTRVVGSSPVTLPGENIYPTVTTAAINTVGGGTRVDSVSGSTVTMFIAPSLMDGPIKVGDRIHCTARSGFASSIVTVVTTSTSPTMTFSMSQTAASLGLVANDVLSFSNQMNYSWPLDDTNKITPGMLITHSSGDGAIVAGTVIGDYKKVLTILSGTEKKEVITKRLRFSYRL
jgi:hypothetical protein